MTKALLHADELEDRLFLAMLDLSRQGAGPEFDLQEVCRVKGIDATPQALLRFTVDNDVLRGSRNVGLKHIRFTMNADGRRHALELEKQKTRTWRDRVGGMSRGEWIGLAGVLATIAGIGVAVWLG